MLCVDVNVLVDAFRADAPHHVAARDWLDAAQRGDDLVVVLPEVIASAMRILTNPRVWVNPGAIDDVVASIDDLAVAKAVVIHEPGPRRWEIFRELLSEHQLHAGDLQDGLLAAAALELGATFVTSDRGFSRFRGLRVLQP